MNAANSKSEKLLTAFPPATGEQWRTAAQESLKSAPFDSLINDDNPEGIRSEPILRQEILAGLPASQTQPGFDGYLRGTKAAGYHRAAWEIAQELPDASPSEFNAAARADLMCGQNALLLNLNLATRSGLDPDQAAAVDVNGLSLAHAEDLALALDGIRPDAISLHFNSGCAGLAVAGFFFAWLKQNDFELKKIKGSLGMDPLAQLAATGSLPCPIEVLQQEQATLAKHCAEHAPNVRAVGVTTLPYHQAGASAVQELAVALATGTNYLNELTANGLSIDQAAQQIRFSFAIGPNFFMEIAKLRAARVLWAQVVAEFGGSVESQKITMHARTGLYNKTLNDPYVNMLRTTTEALSAAISGIDSLCVGHFDEVIEQPNSFSRRISRNTQVILQEECELTRVIDPAGGAWAVEWLTNEIAKKVWAQFQSIEQQGGALEAINNGFLRKLISKTAQTQQLRFNKGQRKLVGTNLYPNLREKPPASQPTDYIRIKAEQTRAIFQTRRAHAPQRQAEIKAALTEIVNAAPPQLLGAIINASIQGASLGALSQSIRRDAASAPAAIQPLTNTRLAAQYEALRQASRDYCRKTGAVPKIFLFNLRPPQRHKLRADFAKSFFQCAGFEVLESPGFKSSDAAIAAMQNSGARVTVICASDRDYVEQFAHYARALKKADPQMRLLLAGAPAEHEAAYRRAGMDDYICIKSNNYEKNRALLQELGLPV